MIFETISVTPVTPRIGATVEGIALAEPPWSEVPAGSTIPKAGSMAANSVTGISGPASFIFTSIASPC